VRKVRILAVAALLALALGMVASVAMAATKRVGVTRSGSRFLFSPRIVTIKKGDSVRWSWSGSIPHNVRGSGGINSGPNATRDTYTKRFTRAGSYSVRCTLHAAIGQTMTVRVR
jgi:plastocyanin